MAEQDLRVTVQQKGAKETAAAIDEVGAASEKVKQQTAGQAQATTAAADAQDKLNASESDYVSLLATLNPRVGLAADTAAKFSKILGDLGTEEIDITAITKKLSEAFSENAGLLGTLGAGGVAAIGFAALAKSISLVVEESKRLQEQLDALQDRATSEQQDVIAGQRDITARSRGRREGGFSAEEDVLARKTFEDAIRTGQVSKDQEDLLKTNIAALSGQVSPQDIATLTRAGETVDAGFSPDDRRRRAENILSRESVQEESQRERDRIAEEIRREKAEAIKEAEAAASDPTRGLANLASTVDRERLLGDRDRIIALSKRAVEIDRNRQKSQFPSANPAKAFEDALQQAAKEQAGFFTDTFTPDTELFPIEREEALRIFQKSRREQFEDRGRGATEREFGGIVNITNIGTQKNVVDSAAARQRRTKNSENDAKRQMARSR